MTSPSGSQFPSPAPEDNHNERSQVHKSETSVQKDIFSSYLEDSSVPQSVLQIVAVNFFQGTNLKTPIAVDIPHQRLPFALSSTSPLILEIAFELTTWGQQKLAQQKQLPQRQSPLSCEIQVFAKPLSPIRTAEHWREAIAIPLSTTQKSYQIQLQSVPLGAGLYSLQLLLLIQNFPSSPLFFDIPIFQIDDSWR
ncbi:MAG: hypothetical protein F6K42_00655 [Leptolyngbya sp. SIO1D8]|nr:hypothetical protein [Leptolyngbya sp. SIO1D8]